ncbi:MAG: TetR/AcrR family transcriptional regulator [Deltaproteobacteria bacterium]|nr:TetR/AcrR family transcriptional regulator [Deltaproteobacteria bacterium]
MLFRPKYHHGDLHRALVDAGLELLESRDASELSLRAVARKAKVSAAAPYHHFANKAELLDAIAAEGFALLESQIRAAMQDADEGCGGELAAGGAAYVQFALAHPSHFRVMFRKGEEEHAPVVDAASSPVFALLVEGVERWLRGHERAEEDARPLILLCWAAIHGIAMLLLDGPSSRWEKLGLDLDKQAIAVLVTRTLAERLTAS